MFGTMINLKPPMATRLAFAVVLGWWAHIDGGSAQTSPAIKVGILND
jgi:hypothetical protein